MSDGGIRNAGKPPLKRFWSRVQLMLVIIAGLSMGGIWVAELKQMPRLTPWFLLAFLVAFAGLVATMRCFVSERRRNELLLAPAAQEVLRGERPYFVYLRSFADERKIQKRYRSSYPTEEERIATAFKEYGSIISIRDPGADLPALGSALFTASNEGWQEDAERLVRGASFVLIRLGDSPGVLWELAMVIRNVALNRVVLLSALTREAHASTSALLRSEFDLQLPPYAHEPCVITLDPRRTADAFLLRGWNLRGGYRQSSMEVSLQAALTPFLRNLGFDARFPELRTEKFAALAFVVLVEVALIWGSGSLPVVWVIWGFDAQASVGFIAVMALCSLAFVFLSVLFVRTIVQSVEEIWLPERHLRLRQRGWWFSSRLTGRAKG